jgi:RNA polymerase sigma factor (sigma-70 family)
MGVSMLGEMLRLLGRRAGAAGDAASDAQLLRRYVESHDESAFTELVRRHGPMVLGVCRRLLRDAAAAEDAFQATFLVLVRRASALCWQDSIAGWLHEVAWRVARKARNRPAQRSTIQEPAMTAESAAVRDVELGEILDEALASLPRHYRTALVLCCFEGKTNEEAAQVLGCPVGTVKSRLARGRELLRKRLLSRGVTLPAAPRPGAPARQVAPAGATSLAGPLAEASVSPQLLQATVAQALAFAKGTAGSSGAVLLARAILHGFAVARAGLGVALGLGVLLLILGATFAVGVNAQPIPPAGASGSPPPLAPGQPPRPVNVPPQPAEDPADPDTPQTNTSLETPLPRGAVARLGTTRYRTGEPVAKLKLAPDGKKLITFGGINGVVVWDAQTGKRIWRRPLAWDGEISRDGDRLFVSEFQLRPKANGKPGAGESGSYFEFLQEVADGKNVKNALKIYRLSDGKLLQRIESSALLDHFVLSPDERTLALRYAVPNGTTPEPNSGRGYAYLFTRHLELYDLKEDRVLHKLGELPQSYNGYDLVRFSADGKTLFVVTCSRENENRPESTVRRFDVATGALKSKTIIPGAGYRSMPNLDDKKTLIVSGNTIWDLEKERLSWASRGELAGIYAFIPDGRTLVGWSNNPKQVAGEDIASQVVYWDMAADREIRRLSARASCLAIAPDGKSCFGAAWNHRWFRWDFATGKELDSADAPTAPAETVVFSPDGKYVVTHYGVWDRATGKLLRQMPPPSPGGGPFFFSPEGKTLVYGAGGVATLSVMETDTWKPGKREFEPPLPLVNNFPLGLDTSSCRVSPDGKVLATPTATWDWAGGKLLGKHEHTYPDGVVGQLGPIAFSSDGERLVSVALLPAPQAHVQVWDLADSKLISDREMTDWPKGLVRNLQLLDDGKLLAAGWLPPRPPWKGMLRFPEEQDKPIPADWPATTPPMPDGVVRVWDAATGREKSRLEFPQQWDNSAIPPVCSPDGKLAVTASSCDSLVRFWDLDMTGKTPGRFGKEVGQFRCPVNGVHCLVFSPDGRILAVSAEDTTVLLVDVGQVVGK